MNRLDFVLPDFTRISWVTDETRAVWEPRIQKITTAWLKLEWLAVSAGIRPCGITVVSPENLIEQGGVWAKHGISVLPIELQSITSNYAATSNQAKFGDPFVIRIVLGTPDSLSKFKDAWDAADNRGIGRLLGYPDCCLDFFEETWVKRSMVDTTWPMAAGVEPDAKTNAVEVTGPPESNILWRWMGVRPVSHLPCSFNCPNTIALAEKFIALGRESGFEQEMDWLLEILAWPVEWSALHGIAEIKTPILKVMSRTDATKTKYLVKRPGTAFPTEGAQGLRFPFRIPKKTVSESRGFQRGLDNPIMARSERPLWFASDNGFTSLAAMAQAHSPVVDVAAAALTGVGGNVLDLGCGNGALLEQIRQRVPDITPFGIDIEGLRITHAQEILPEFADNFVAGDIFSDNTLMSNGRRFSLALVMPGRLLEAGPERAAELRQQIADRCDRVLVYAYGDWLNKYGGLGALARKAGLNVLSTGNDVTASLATVSTAQVVERS